MHGNDLKGNDMNWYLEVLKKYAEFSGRARRKEYWFFVLFSSVIGIGLVVIDFLAGTIISDSGVGVMSGIYYLAVLIPGLAVSVRRLHDTDRSGWMMLIGLIPCVGLVLLFFMVQDGTRGRNKFGSDPKGATG